MKFTVKKSDVSEVLSKVQGITSRKTGMDITKNVLIQSVDSGIKIMATDLETNFEGVYPANIESEGMILINGKKLSEIVKDFPDQDILINELDKYWIEIGNKTNVEYRIAGINPEDFPELPDINEVEFFEIHSTALKSMIEKALIINIWDDMRDYIIGVFFQKTDTKDNQTIRMVSTDAGRLLTIDHFYEKNVKLPDIPDVLIPKKGLNEVNKFIDNKEVVRIGIKDDYFVLKKEVETITIRLLEEDFPEYKDIIKRDEDNLAVLDKNKFQMMLKRMSILSSERYKGAVFSFSKDKLVISSANPDIGESKEDLAVEFKGKPVKAFYNIKFFTEILGAIEEDKVVLNIIDQEKPCLIQGQDNDNFLSLIMPMKM